LQRQRMPPWRVQCCVRNPLRTPRPRPPALQDKNRDWGMHLEMLRQAAELPSFREAAAAAGGASSSGDASAAASTSSAPRAPAPQAGSSDDQLQRQANQLEWLLSCDVGQLGAVLEKARSGGNILTDPITTLHVAFLLPWLSRCPRTVPCSHLHAPPPRPQAAPCWPKS